MAIHPARSVSASVAVSQSILATFGVSYALSPMDEFFLAPMEMQSANGEYFSLLVPVHLPVSSFDALAFQKGAVIGYECREEMGETPVQVVNLVYRGFQGDLSAGGVYAWNVGFLLGCLSALAEVNCQLALVGIAHLCFLVSSMPNCSTAAFRRALIHVGTLHDAVVQTYRARVRAFREQGMGFEEAWQLALSR